MKLISVYEWRDMRFTGNRRPSDRTLRKWCENGDIPSKKIGGLWFVELQAEMNNTGNELVDRVLSGTA